MSTTPDSKPSHEKPWEVTFLTTMTLVVFATSVMAFGIWWQSGSPINILTMGLMFSIMPLLVLGLIAGWIFSALASRSYATSLRGHLLASGLAIVLIVLLYVSFVLRHYVT